MFGLPLLCLQTIFDFFLFFYHLFGVHAKLRYEGIILKDINTAIFRVIEIFIKQEMANKRTLISSNIFIKRLQRCLRIPQKIQQLLYQGIDLRNPKVVEEMDKEYYEEFNEILEEVPELKIMLEKGSAAEIIE